MLLLSGQCFLCLSLCVIDEVTLYWWGGGGGGGGGCEFVYQNIVLNIFRPLIMRSWSLNANGELLSDLKPERIAMDACL